MYLPISAYHHLGWYWPPFWNLDSSSLDRILPGLRHIHPCHGQDEQVMFCMQEKHKDRMMPQSDSVCDFLLTDVRLPGDAGHHAPAHLAWQHHSRWGLFSSSASDLHACQEKILDTSITFIIPRFFPLDLQFLSHFYNQGFKLSFLAPFWWLQFFLIRNWQ